MKSKYKQKTLIFIINTLIFLILGSSSLLSKNEANQHIKNGNSFYKEQKYKDAEIEYRKALDLDANSNIAKFNLGNSLYRQGRFDEALKTFDLIDKNKFDKKSLANSYHNLGNSYFQQKEYEKSIESYKKALLNNPNDKETKYNLEYARRLLQQQLQSKNQNNNQNQQNNQNRNQKQQSEQPNEQQKDKKEKQDQNNPQQQNNQKLEQNQNSQQQKKQNISKEDAERILQALMNKEKELQKQMQKKNAVRGRLSKNW